jgi:3-hydroxymyristoyl/3-hydroxydecanoyl-(acyl carrier protein) dehydratase
MSTSATISAGRRTVSRFMAVALSGLFWLGSAIADEAPISGIVKFVDPAAQTLTLESTAKGKTRQVVVHLKLGTRIVKFIRSAEPGKTGFVEQALTLAELKPGWIVSVEARHEGDKEVADVVRVVLER